MTSAREKYRTNVWKKNKIIDCKKIKYLKYFDNNKWFVDNNENIWVREMINDKLSWHNFNGFVYENSELFQTLEKLYNMFMRELKLKKILNTK